LAALPLMNLAAARFLLLLLLALAMCHARIQRYQLGRSLHHRSTITRLY